MMSEASRRAAAEQYVRDMDHCEANRVVFLAGWDAAMVAVDTAVARAVEGERTRLALQYAAQARITRAEAEVEAKGGAYRTAERWRASADTLDRMAAALRAPAKETGNG